MYHDFAQAALGEEQPMGVVRHYTTRLRHSHRLPYRAARVLAILIPMGLLVYVIYASRN